MMPVCNTHIASPGVGRTGYGAHVGRDAALKPNSTLRIRIWVSELALTSGAVLLLMTLATSLAMGERPLGLDQRYVTSQRNTPLESAAYASAITTTPASVFDFAPRHHNKAARAQWLNRHAGAVLGMLATCGWLTLTLGRSGLGIKSTSPLIASLWLLNAHALGIFGVRWPSLWIADSWLYAAAAFLLAATMTFMRASLLRNTQTVRWRFAHAAASPWIYPGFVLFCGLGWLWLLDWAARGHLNKQFIGLYQLDSLWLAFAIFTLVAAHHGYLLAGMSRLASLLDNIGARWIAMPNALLLLAILLWTGMLIAVAHNSVTSAPGIKIYQRHAALLAELMRVPIWLVLGWVIYRWIESGQRLRQGALATVTLLLTMLLGLKLDRDGGALLAQTIAVIWIFCGMAQGILRQRASAYSHAMLRWLLPTAAAALGTAAAIWLAFTHAPSDRLDAMALDYRGPLDFLSVIHWLLDAVPAFGFGLGNTPWCGYAHVAGLIAQCTRAGVPDQIQSDYVSFALLALWGPLAALLILTALLLWLWELMRHGPETPTSALNFGLLRQWIVTGFAVTSAVQIVISTAGTLGKMPLTGLAIPMLSLGSAGLISTALFAGLSVNRLYLQHQETRQPPVRL